MEKQEKVKPGPTPGEPTKQVSVMLPPALAEWGKKQHGGLSELVRQLLEEERKRRESVKG